MPLGYLRENRADSCMSVYVGATVAATGRTTDHADDCVHRY